MGSLTRCEYEGRWGQWTALGSWGADQVSGVFLPRSHIFLVHSCYSGIFGGNTLKFLLIVMFYFCIYYPGSGSGGWDCAALLSLWSLFPGGFHPRQGWCVSCGETPFLGDQKLLICHGGWEQWNVWSKRKGPEILRIKPCPWDEIQPKCVSSSRTYFSSFIPRMTLSSF